MSLLPGDIVNLQGRKYTVQEVYNKEWLKSMTSPEHYREWEYGVLLKDETDYQHRGLVHGSSIDVKPLGTKHCPPPAPTEAQMKAFAERIEKARKRKQEEDEQIQNSEQTQSRIVLTDKFGLPARKAKAAKPRAKLTRR